MNSKNAKSVNLSFDAYWLRFIKTCLRPLVRILVKQKVEFNSFQNLVRELFVEEAEKHITETSENCRGKISSIAYQTGLDRREVSRILKNNESSSHLEVARSREGNILDHWLSNPPFCDSDGNAVPLKRSGPGLSFEMLTRRFGKNISHGPILDSFIEAKCVEVRKGKVHLIKKAFVPKQPVSPEKIDIAAKSISRLTATIKHNFENETNTNFQRNLFSLQIPEHKTAMFKLEITEMMTELYEETIIPRFEAIEEKYQDISVPKYESRIGLGFFYFEEFE